MVLAVFALLASIYLCWSSVRTAQAANDRSEAVRLLAWNRVLNEIVRTTVVIVVLTAGISQITTPTPMAPSPYRWWFQFGWALIGLLMLLMSLRNEYVVSRVVDLIDEEN